MKYKPTNRTISLRQYKDGHVSIKTSIDVRQKAGRKVGTLRAGQGCRYNRTVLIPLLKADIRKLHSDIHDYKAMCRDFTKKANEAIKVVKANEKRKKGSVETIRKREKVRAQKEMTKRYAVFRRQFIAKRQAVLDKKEAAARKRQVGMVSTRKLKEPQVLALIYAQIVPKQKIEKEVIYLLIISRYERFDFLEFKRWGIRLPTTILWRSMQERGLMFKFKVGIKAYYIISPKGRDLVRETTNNFRKLCKDLNLME